MFNQTKLLRMLKLCILTGAFVIVESLLF